MKKFSKISIAALIAVASLAIATPSKAQSYQSTPDIIYGQRCYVERNGRHVAHGDKNGTGAYSWPSTKNTQVVYYLHVPEGYTKMNAYITPKSKCSLHLVVTDPETEATVYETEAGASGTKSVAAEMMTDFNFPKDQWYRFEFSAAPENSSIASIEKLEFYRESTKNITTSAIFMAPSTHLWTSTPYHPAAPSGQAYDWAYEEVMYPSIYERGARYVEAINTMKGYMGIQYTESGNRNVIFSMWDNGSTDTDPNLPDYLRSGLMDKDPRVTAERFKGEGTGQKTIFEHGQYYRPDTWVQFLFNARPEILNITVKGSKGQDSTIVYNNSITTAWYKMADDNDWTFISTLRSSGAPTYFNNWCSFLENFGDNGCEYSRAYYRKCYMRSVADGKWYNINHFTFGHTQGTSARNSRSDYGHGVSDIYTNAFYMEHGAYTTRVNDSSQYAGIPADQSCVDTIDIDAKIERVNLSVLRNAKQQTIDRLNSTGEIYDMTKWEVIGFSDQEEEAVANNGHASMSVDGDDKTYWQNKWRNGGINYPHWIALKAPEKVAINQIDLTSAKTSYLYWPKTLLVHTSEDGINWTVASDTVEIPKKAKSTVSLPDRISSQYFKIEFVDAYGAMLYINEMVLSTDASPEKIMKYAKELIDNADRFGSYTSEDIKPLEAVYDNGNGNSTEVSEAIIQLAENAKQLKYGGMKFVDNISSMCIYQLCNYKGYGKLIVADGKPTIGEAASPGALYKYKNKVNVTQYLNNWMIVRCEQYKCYYLYNPGINKYLDLSSPTLLSDTPAQVSLNYRYPDYCYYIMSNGKYLSLDPTSASQPIKAVSSADDKCYFMLYSNHYLMPKQEFAKSMVAECEDYAKFNSYVTKAGNMLKIPEGNVGYPLGASREQLAEIYDNGHVTIEQRHELYDAVDNCERIPFDPARYCYRIKSATSVASASYYTATATPSVSAQPLLDNDPAQIWSLRSRAEGLMLSAQNTVMGRLPDYSYYNLPMTTLGHSNDYGKYYVTESSPGNFIFSTNNYGGIALASAPEKFGQPSSYSEYNASMNLQLAEDIKVELNAAGMKSINYNFDVIVPEDLAIYVVDHIEDGTACFLRVYDRLPAGTPAVIKGEPNSQLTLQIAAPSGKPIEDNMLKGTYFATSAPTGAIYTLSTEAGGTFAKSSATLKANSAYLLFSLDQKPDGDSLALDFSDEPTALTSPLATPATDTRTYNLQGQPVDTTVKGQIYIKQGSKIKN